MSLTPSDSHFSRSITEMDDPPIVDTTLGESRARSSSLHRTLHYCRGFLSHTASRIILLSRQSAGTFLQTSSSGKGKSFPDNADLSDAPKVISSFKSNCAKPDRFSLARCQETHYHPFSRGDALKNPSGKVASEVIEPEESEAVPPPPRPRVSSLGELTLFPCPHPPRSAGS